MSDKRFTIEINCGYDESLLKDNNTGELLSIIDCCIILNKLYDEILRIKKYGTGKESIKLSFNNQTGKLEKHNYATGQWFGDFDRILCKQHISSEDYQRFIKRIIEVYHTEFYKKRSD